MLVYNENITWCNNPEDHNLNSYKNLKSYNPDIILDDLSWDKSSAVTRISSLSMYIN